MMNLQHANLRTLGMRLCHPKSPRCDICPLADTCEHGVRVLGRKTADINGPAARKPTGDAAQPWMKFHAWGEEELPDAVQPASATSVDQPATSGEDGSSCSNRRVFKGCKLTPVSTADSVHDEYTAFPAVNALCHARGAGDYCQLESWEVIPTAESVNSHSILPVSEQTCLGMQRSVGPETKSRLTAKYFGNQKLSSGTSLSTGPNLELTSVAGSLQAGSNAENRTAKILALSQHDRTLTTEAIHASRIAQKRRAAAALSISSSNSRFDGSSRSVRRRLDFETDLVEAPAGSETACEDQKAVSEITAQSESSDVPADELSCVPLPYTQCTGASTAASLPTPVVAEVVAGIVDEIERRANAPKLYILTDFFEDVSTTQPTPGASAETVVPSNVDCHVDKSEAHVARTAIDTETDAAAIGTQTVRRWVQALRVYHNTDLWAPPGFDNDSNFERNEVWVSMERVLLPIDQGTTLRRRTIDFSTASPPCHNYVCHSMIKPHSRCASLESFIACCVPFRCLLQWFLIPRSFMC